MATDRGVRHPDNPLRQRLQRRWRRGRSILALVPDREHEMSANRLIFGLIGNAYLFIGPSRTDWLSVTFGSAYVMLALAVLIDLLVWRKRSAIRRIIALVADMAAISYGMHIGGQATSLFYPLYLWATFGNGFRFGNGFLFIAAGCSLAGFGLVIGTTPFWQAIPATACGLLAALVVLPKYTSTLIMRLSAATQAAEAASRSKSMFLASISHEFRTPLNAILGSVSLLDSTRLDSEQRELAASLQSGSQRLLDLINDVLDFSRLDAGRMPVEPTSFPLAPLLAEIAVLLLPQVRMKRLRLSLHVTPDVPDLVTMDRRHLYEILLNLTSNAVKFTSTGGVIVHVDREPGLPSGDRLRFSITDTGIGIKQSAFETIFESFAQADGSIIDKFGGTGLGLAICKRLVTLMGGVIGVDSIPGRGSTFWCTLACGPDAAGSDAGAVAQVSDARPSPVLQRMLPTRHVVVLMDDPELRARACRELAAAGCAGIVVPDMDNAVRTLRANPGQRVLLLHRDSPADLDLDCTLLDRLDPACELPAILVAARSASASVRSTERRFNTTVTPALEAGPLLRAVQLAQSLHPLPHSPPTLAIRAARALHVLVADDNAINRQVVSKVLEQAGHSLVLVANGEEALDALVAGRFDLVLMDVNMPVLNGIDATRLHRLAEFGLEHVPIVALTADPTDDMRKRCLEAGMDQCIAKPIAPRRLIEMIDSVAAAHPVAAGGSHASSAAGPEPEGVVQLARHPHFRAVLPALDHDVLGDLEALGGAAFVAELLVGFQQDAGVLIERVGEAAAAGNMPEFRNQLHALRSIAANIGALALHEVAGSCRSLETADLPSEGASVARRLGEEHERLGREILAVPRATA